MCGCYTALGCAPSPQCDIKRCSKSGYCLSPSTTTTTENAALACRSDLTDFWPDCRVRIDDRLKDGAGYCTFPFDRAGCEKSCCQTFDRRQTTVTTTTELLTQCETLADKAMDCETRIRDRFQDGADYCATEADYGGCKRSCCLKIGTPIQFTIAMQGLNYSDLTDNASLEQMLTGAVAETVATEADVSTQNVFITFEQSVSLPIRLRRLQTAPMDDEDYLLIEISVSSSTPPSKLMDRIRPDLAVKVASTLEHVEGIDAVLQDQITIASMTAPEVLQLERTQPNTQNTLDEKYESSSAYGMCGSVAALVTAGLTFSLISRP